MSRIVRQVIVVIIFTLSVVECFACQVQVGALAFGQYSVFSKAAKRSRAKISVKCGKGIAYFVTLSPGSSGRYDMRHLQSVMETLNYNLYLKLSGTWRIWGDGLSGTARWSAKGKNRWRRKTILGIIPAKQNVSVGQYQDQILVEVNY